MHCLEILVTLGIEIVLPMIPISWHYERSMKKCGKLIEKVKKHCDLIIKFIQTIQHTVLNITSPFMVLFKITIA